MPSLGPDWLNATTLLAKLGPSAFWATCAIVFAECGLFVFFLPGDSLLFTVGLFIGQGSIHVNLVLACLVLSAFAFAGNVTGYEIGRAVGGRLYHPGGSAGRYLRPEYFERTTAFFDAYGSRALVLGRFVPIVRTFITVVAGVGRMPRRRFFVFSLIGAVVWASGVTVLGYFLGSLAFVRTHIDVILVLVVLVSLIPVAVEYLRHRSTTSLA